MALDDGPAGLLDSGALYAGGNVARIADIRPAPSCVRCDGDPANLPEFVLGQDFQLCMRNDLFGARDKPGEEPTVLACGHRVFGELLLFQVEGEARPWSLEQLVHGGRPGREGLD